MSFRLLFMPCTLSFFLLVTACSDANDLRGSYIADEGQDVLMLQVSSVTEGIVQGGMSVVSVNEKGEIEAGTRPISGTLEGRTLNLTMKRDDGVTVITGTAETDTLSLSIVGSGFSGALNLVKSDASKFDLRLKELQSQSINQKIALEEAAAHEEKIAKRSKIQKEINEFSTEIMEISKELNQRAKNIESIIHDYDMIKNEIDNLISQRDKIDKNSQYRRLHAAQINNKLIEYSNGIKISNSNIDNYNETMKDYFTKSSLRFHNILSNCRNDDYLNCKAADSNFKILNDSYFNFRMAVKREQDKFNSIRRN